MPRKARSAEGRAGNPRHPSKNHGNRRTPYQVELFFGDEAPREPAAECGRRWLENNRQGRFEAVVASASGWSKTVQPGSPNHAHGASIQLLYGDKPSESAETQGWRWLLHHREGHEAAAVASLICVNKKRQRPPHAATASACDLETDAQHASKNVRCSLDLTGADDLLSFSGAAPRPITPCPAAEMVTLTLNRGVQSSCVPAAHAQAVAQVVVARYCARPSALPPPSRSTTPPPAFLTLEQLCNARYLRSVWGDQASLSVIEEMAAANQRDLPGLKLCAH